jgi:hypothetical protein
VPVKSAPFRTILTSTFSGLIFPVHTAVIVWALIAAAPIIKKRRKADGEL